MQFPLHLAAFEENTGNFYKGTWSSGAPKAAPSCCQCRSDTSDTAPCQIPSSRPGEKGSSRGGSRNSSWISPVGLQCPNSPRDAKQEQSRGWALMEADSSELVTLTPSLFSAPCSVDSCLQNDPSLLRMSKINCLPSPESDFPCTREVQFTCKP